MIKIKEFKPSLGSEITEAFLDILTDAFKHERIDIYLAKSRFKSRYLNNIKTFGIYLDEILIGAASLLIEKKMFRKDKPNIGHIEDVAIHKDHRGFGYGRKLIDYIVEYAKTKDCYKIVLYCSNDNIKFYKKCGFRNTSNLMRKDLD